jgi:hypothetical protein
MIIQHDKRELPFDLPSRDGDHDAKLIKVRVASANLDTVIPHKLGRVPRQIAIVWKDGFLDFKVSRDASAAVMVDDEKAVLQFSAANVTAVLRFA